MWLAMSGSPVTDEILEWAPDLFALSEVIFDHTQAYRFVLSPPGDATWPPDRYDSWAEAVEDAGREWSGWRRSQPPGFGFNPIVGLWRDPVRGTREVPLEAGAHGVLMTICGDRALRRTADSRRPIDNAVHYFDVSVHQIHAAATGSESRPADASVPAPPPLEVEELTVLTGWAQAVAETVVTAPERLPDLLADARPGAGWRTELKIVEPSPHLAEAIDMIGRIVRAHGRPDGPPTFDALLAAVNEQRPEEPKLGGLVRRVLRSTLEQAHSRNAATAARH